MGGRDLQLAVHREADLKLFLIDAAGDVREIYTSNFLHPRTVLNDIETPLLEQP